MISDRGEPGGREPVPHHRVQGGQLPHPPPRRAPESGAQVRMLK